MAQTARTIRVTIDPASAKTGASVVKSELRGIAGEARNTSRAQSELTKAANDNTRAFRETARATTESSRAMLSLNNAIKGFIGYATARYVIGLADSYTRFTNSLRVANVEGDNQRLVIDKLYSSAQRYGVQLEAMGALYGKASQAQKSLNASQGDLLKFTDGVAAALKVQGGSVTDAAGALHQLGQAITGNKIQAEEYNSILDGAYPILQAVAAGSDKYKGSVAALTKEVKAGNVTSKQFFDDFLKGSSFLEQRAAKSNFTVASSWQVLTNAVTKYIGETDQANAITASLGAGLRGLGNNLDTVVPLVSTLALGLGVGFVTRALAAQVAATGATSAMAAMGVTARGAGSAMLGAFGGPIGLAITGLSVLLLGLYNDSRNMEAAFDSTATAADKFGVTLSAATKAAMAASSETRGVGTSAASAEPEIWSFSNATGNLTKQLWEQAKAARAARVELLQKQLADANDRVGTGQDATFEGARMNSRNAFNAFGKGDILAGLDLAGKSITSDVRNLFSGGRTGREGRALAADNGRIGAAIQKQIDAANNTPIGKSDVPTGGGRITPDDKKGGSKDKGASEAERKAKAQADFWKGLEKELELSKLTTAQAEIRRSEMEIEELTGKKINDINAERVKLGEKTAAQLIQQREAARFIAQANETNRNAEIDYANAKALADAKQRGMTEEQLAAEKAALEFKAQVLKSNIALSAEELAKQTEQVRQRALENAELEKRNRLLEDGISAANKYSTSFALAQQNKSFENERKGLDALYNGGNNPNFTKSQYDEAVKGLNRAISDAAQASSVAMRNHWGQTIEDLGYQISGKWGAAFDKIGRVIQGMVGAASGDFAGGGVLGSIAGLFGKKSDGAGNIINTAFGDAIQSGAGKFSDKLFGTNGQKSAFSEPLKSISTSITDFKNAFDPQKGGSIVKGLGNALGGAMQGAALGSGVANMGKMVWGKFSSGGSQLGGALGGMTGNPLIALGGSLVGGIVGGLLKKAKWGTTSITNGVASTAGNKQAFKDNSSTAGNSITSGLASIAEQLGGEANGNFSVSIGQYKDKWRVSTSGREGKLKGKYGDVKDFGKEGAEAALAFAIQDAIKDGAITGLRASTQALLAAGDDVEGQLQKALRFENVFKELKARTNPVTAAVESLNTEMKSLTKVFQEAGASSEEYGKLEELRQLKMKDILDDALSGYQDTLKLIRGDASGKSQLTLYNEEMKKLDGYRSTLAAGGTVDSDTFNELVQSIVGRAGNLWGTQTAQYQGALNDLGSLVDTAMANTKSEYDKAASAAMGTTSAVDNMNTQVTDRLDTTNELLANMLNVLTKGNFNGKVLTAVNGQLVNAK